MISKYNKAIIETLNPHLWMELEELEKKLDETKEAKVHILATPSGEKTMAMEKEGEMFYLHSRYQPSFEAEKIYKKFSDLTEDTIVVLYGIGLGYLLLELLRHFPRMKFFLVEPNLEVLYRFLEQRELKDFALQNLDGICTNFHQLEIYFTRFYLKYPGQIKIISLPRAEQADFPFFEQFNKMMIKTMRQNLEDQGFFESTQMDMVISQLQNFRAVLSTPNFLTQDLKGTCGKIALIVAAGPSLEDEFENLKTIKKKKMAYIFAVGSAVNSLISHGIYPDAVFSYDPSPENQRVLQKIKEEKITEIPLIFGAGIGYESLINYPGAMAHVLTSSGQIINHFLRYESKERPPIGLTGPTISCLALHVCLQMGFSEIIFVGQNLGKRGSELYSSGISYLDGMTESLLHQFTEIEEDVEGKPMYTLPAYIMMRDALEGIIKMWKEKENPETKIWNATREGIAIKGAKYCVLPELMRRMQENSIEENWFQTELQKSYRRDIIKEKIEEVEKRRSELDRKKNLMNRVLQKMKKQAELGLYSKLPPLYRQLNFSLRELEKNSFAAGFIIYAIYHEYQSLVMQIDYFNTIQDEKEKYFEIYAAFLNFWNIYQAAESHLNPHLDEMIRVLKNYGEEQENENHG